MHVLNRGGSIFVCAFLLLLGNTCLAASNLDDFADKQGSISISGGTAHIPVMKEAAKNIMTRFPKIQITIAGGGSGVGVKQVGEGLVEIGNTGRPLKKKEREEYTLVTYPFAIDGVAVIVNPDNAVLDVNSEQIKDIYAGKISNWQQVGGKDAAISIYTREDGSGTREVFVEKGLNNGDIVQTAAIVTSNGAMKIAVSKNANGIGYVGIGHVDTTVKTLRVNGIAATQENAANGVYPVTRELFMNTKKNPTSLTKSFINYILDSEDGKKAIINSGYIPLAKK